MSPELTITILLFLSFMVVLVLGLPVAFCLMGVSLLFTVLFISPNASFMLFTSAYSVMVLDIYLAVPLFIFMAHILQFSGIASDLYEMMYKWSGSLRGGLAAGTIFICTLIAAMTGLGGTGVVTMGLVAYPEMAKRGYHKHLSVGVIPIGGALGPLIPPSILMVILGGLASLSVGKLFAGGLLPGLLMSALFIMYVFIACKVNPKLAPSLPPEELATWKEKFASTRALVLPLLIIVGVLGGIYSGAATPTEAASIGALGAALAAAVHRKLAWSNFKQAVEATLRVNAMVMWLLIGGMTFSYFLSASGAGRYLVELFLGAQLGIYPTVIIMMLIVLLLGMFIDGSAITMICVPIFYPIINEMGVDPIWFGLLFVISLVIGYVSPPFGMNLFYMKGILPASSNVSMQDIYLSVVPYCGLQLLTLALCLMFPALILWLPGLMK